jgi:TctA family transporter
LLQIIRRRTLIGFVLGPMLEKHFRRVMLFSRGCTAVIFEGLGSATLLVLCLAICASNLRSGYRHRKSALA